MNDLFPQSQETFAEHSANENILRSWGHLRSIVLTRTFCVAGFSIL
jgi:hypothetical protein